MVNTSPYHHGGLYSALLDAGDKLLHDVGLRGFTLRGCARLAGVSHAAPKHHFGDVAGFLTAIAARGFKRLSASLREEIRQAKTLEEEFAATSIAYMRFAEQNPEHFRIMFRCDLLNMESPRLKYYIGATLTELTNLILRHQGEPEISVEELNDRVATQKLMEDIILGWSHIHGLAHLRLEQQLTMLPDDLYK
ncbi:MAG: TetR/AcrR family transcriptional regulator, partial [Gammaproteobacteria bacterium]|nr:TetR/AcrR family transcriptional regulator [Gammaproteobacteria bacterium]